jgi:pimeloyl-ACP methyl ester carboxylesterase
VSVALAIAALAAVTGPAVYGSTSGPAPQASPAGGGWVTTAPMPIDAFGASAASRGWVFGGYSFSAGQNLDTAYRYDPFGDHWTQLASMFDAHLMSSAVFYPPTNSIYVFGGAIRDPDTLPPPVDYCRVYHPGNDTWDTCPSLPDVRGFMASGYDPANGKIYLAGGYNTATIDSAQTTTWEFDPIAGTYTQKADIPGSARPFFQAGYANFNPKAVTKVDYRNPKRPPLLLVTGSEDRICPPAVLRANFKKQRQAPTATDSKEYPGRCHFPGQDGWEEVADYILSWTTEHANRPAASPA